MQAKRGREIEYSTGNDTRAVDEAIFCRKIEPKSLDQ
jgi:hypothetical protein